MRPRIFLSLVFLFFVLMGIYAQNTKQTEQSYRPELKVAKKAYPVYLHSDTLFYIDTNFAILTAEERADNISKRLHKIYKEADSIRIESIILIML